MPSLFDHVYSASKAAASFIGQGLQRVSQYGMSLADTGKHWSHIARTWLDDTHFWSSRVPILSTMAANARSGLDIADTVLAGLGAASKGGAVIGDVLTNFGTT